MLTLTRQASNTTLPVTEGPLRRSRLTKTGTMNSLSFGTVESRKHGICLPTNLTSSARQGTLLARLSRDAIQKEIGVITGRVTSLKPLMVTALDGPEARGYEWEQVRPIPKGSVEDWAASSCAEGVWPWWLGSCGSAGLQRTSARGQMEEQTSSTPFGLHRGVDNVCRWGPAFPRSPLGHGP